jgi:hypothetical protein
MSFSSTLAGRRPPPPPYRVAMRVSSSLRSMLTLSFLASALWARLGHAQACVGSLPASNGNTCRETLAVNAQSFLGSGSGILWGTTFEIERIVRNSARAWSQFASARRGFEYVGTTSAMDCGSGFQHLVVGAIGVCTPIQCVIAPSPNISGSASRATTHFAATKLILSRSTSTPYNRPEHSNLAGLAVSKASLPTNSATA